MITTDLAEITNRILPILRRHGVLRAAIFGSVARGEARARGLLNDPQVNERIIRRELNVRPQGEQVIQWSPDELAAAAPGASLNATQPAGAGPQENSSRCVAVLARWLPDWPYQDLFARSPQRPLLMAMAGGLLLAAFMLYAPNPAPEP